MIVDEHLLLHVCTCTGESVHFELHLYDTINLTGHCRVDFDDARRGVQATVNMKRPM